MTHTHTHSLTHTPSLWHAQAAADEADMVRFRKGLRESVCVHGRESVCDRECMCVSVTRTHTRTLYDAHTHTLSLTHTLWHAQAAADEADMVRFRKGSRESVCVCVCVRV